VKLLRATGLVNAPLRVVSATLTERALFQRDDTGVGAVGAGDTGEPGAGKPGPGNPDAGRRAFGRRAFGSRAFGRRDFGEHAFGGHGFGSRACGRRAFSWYVLDGRGAGADNGSTNSGEDGVLAPGDQLVLAGGRYRVAELDVRGLELVPVGGPPVRLLVRLAPTAAGVLVTATAAARTAIVGIVLRRRLLALLTSTVDNIRERAEGLAGAGVVVGTAIVRDGAVLAQQRAYPPAAAGRWELPGGRVEPGESDVDAVRRECMEELGVDVVVGDPAGPDVLLGNGMLLRVYRAELSDPAAVPHAHDHQALRWLTTGRLGSVDWLPADRVFLPALRRLLADTDRPPRQAASDTRPP
jgi:8-oxo-dGTP diphosphatase